MPSFTFKGFTTGNPVSLSATQGGTTVPASVLTWGENTVEEFEGSFTITATEAATIPAPTAVWFEASNLQGFDVEETSATAYDPSFDGVTFVWTVERTGAGANEAVHGTYGAVPKLVDGWNSTRVAYGKKVAFFFDEPDVTYQVRCWAIDQSGNRGVGTRATGEEGLEITTQNADDIYGGIATICLDPSGAFTGAPSGAQQVTSVLALEGAINQATTPRRVLIARGQDISGFKINENGGSHVRYVGAFGSGDRPILRSDGSIMFDFYETSAPQLTLEGLDCRGLWDAPTETGLPTDAIRPFRSSLQNFSLWDCRFDGFKLLNPTLSDDAPFLFVMGKTEVTNWSDYGMYIAPSPNAKLALLGCDIAQHVDAINHSQNERDGMSNSQGPVRAVQYDTFYIGASSFLSRGGWSGGNDQPCLRLNSSGARGVETIVERSTIEAGAVLITMSGSNSGTTETEGSYLFDKVLMLAGGGKTGYEMGFAHFGGSTFRNVLFAMLNAPNVDNLGFSNCLNLIPHQSDPDNLATPLKVYNCTSLNTRSAANDFGDNARLAGSGPFSAFVEENNVVHAPTLDNPTPANSVDISGAAFFAPRYRGIKPNFDFEQGTLGGSVGNGQSFTLPYPAGTDQAYWQAIEATDTMHMMRMGSTPYYAAFDNNFTVAYESSQIRITNTSGSTWSGGTGWKLRLDRKTHIPAMNTTYGNPTSMALPTPVPGSGITQNNDGTGTGLWAYDDFTGTPRPFERGGQAQTDHTGAARPVAGRAQGAVQF